jgi:hypothetical protein
MSRRHRMVSTAQWAALAGLDDGRSLAAARALIAEGDGPQLVQVRRRQRTDNGVPLRDHRRWVRTKLLKRQVATALQRPPDGPLDPENGSHCDLAALAVYDAHDSVGSVVKRDDQHYAYTAGGKLIGVFRPRVEAAPAIPAKGGVRHEGRRRSPPGRTPARPARRLRYRRLEIV